jgi:hypothetical protein
VRGKAASLSHGLTAEAGFAGSARIAAFRGILTLGNVTQLEPAAERGGRGLLCWPGPGEPARAVRQHMLTPGDCQHMLTVMESALEIAEGAASTDPDVGLRAVAALRTLTERLEILQVENARTLGWSWQDIATRLGVTKQTVHRKHGKRTGAR